MASKLLINLHKNETMKEEIERTPGGVKITIKTIGKGDNAIYRLMVEGGIRGTYSTKEAAQEAKKDYISGLKNKKTKRK